MANVTLIRNIRFDDFGFVAQQGHFRAVVIMTTDRSTICLLVRHPCPEDTPATVVRQGLICDAIRQVSQLPEYRTGRSRIVIALDEDRDRRQIA